MERNSKSVGIGIDVYDMVASGKKESIFGHMKKVESEKCSRFRSVAYETCVERMERLAEMVIQKENLFCIQQLKTAFKKEMVDLGKFQTRVVFRGNHALEIWSKPLLEFLNERYSFVPIIDGHFKSSKTIVQNIVAQFQVYHDRLDQQATWLGNAVQKLVQETCRMTRPQNIHRGGFVEKQQELMLVNELQKPMYRKASTIELYRNFEVKLKTLLKLDSPILGKMGAYEVLFEEYVDSLSTMKQIGFAIELIHGMEKSRAGYMETLAILSRMLCKLNLKMLILNHETSRTNNEDESMERQEIFENKSKLYEERLKETALRKQVKGKFKLPIVITKYEGVDSAAFSKFLAMIADIATIPVEFIIEMAWDASPTFRRMPNCISQYLEISCFHLASADICIDALLKKLCVSNHMPFTLSGEVMSWIRDSYFGQMDHSISSTMKILKYVAFEHFSKIPYSFLCYNSLEILDMQEQSTISLLTEGDMSLLGAQLQHDSLNQMKVNQLLENAYFQQDALAIVCKCFEYSAEKLHPTLEITNLLASLVDNNLASIQRCMQSQIVHSNFQDLLNIASGVLRILVKASNSLDFDVKHHHASKPPTQLFAPVIEELKMLRNMFNYSVLNPTDQDCTENLALMQQDLMNVFFKLLPKTLMLPTDSMAKLFIYHDVATLKSTFLAKHHSNLVQQIKNPSLYIKMCPRLQKTLKLSYKLDISIAYQLYSTYGTRINVADWLEHFADAIENKSPKATPRRSSERPSRESPRTPPSDTTKVRFMRVVSILEAMGFIKGISSTTCVEKIIYI